MTDIATLDAARMDVPQRALEELRTQVRGAVLVPSDPGQEDVRDVFNTMHPESRGGDGALLRDGGRRLPR